MDVKGFVLSYARYRRLGFDRGEALDIALMRSRVTPILAGKASREVSELQQRRSQLRVVK